MTEGTNEALHERVADAIMFEVGALDEDDAAALVDALLTAVFRALRGRLDMPRDDFDLVVADARRDGEQKLARMIGGAVRFADTVEAAVEATVEMLAADNRRPRTAKGGGR